MYKPKKKNKIKYEIITLNILDEIQKTGYAMSLCFIGNFGTSCYV